MSDAVPEDDQFQLAIRPADAGDLNYILNSWLKGILKGTTFGRSIPAETFWANHRGIVVGLIQRSQVFVAHPEGDPETILGWVCFEPETSTLKTVIHWVYVRSTWRGLGIARRLLDAAAIDLDACVHSLRSFDADPVLRNHPGAEFNPYLHFFPTR